MRRIPEACIAVALVALLGLAAGCRTARDVAPPQTTAATPARPAPPPAGFTRYRIDPAASQLRVLVYRSGPMALVGHNHVISSRGLQGEILLDASARHPSATLRLPVASLEVDRPEERAGAGADFPGVISASDIEGTRRNMLGERLLDAARFPDISLEVGGEAIAGPPFVLEVRATVLGATHPLRIPVDVAREGDALVLSGECRIRQTALGLEPFTVMGGLLSVQDEITVRYRFVAAPG